MRQQNSSASNTFKVQALHVGIISSLLNADKFHTFNKVTRDISNMPALGLHLSQEIAHVSPVCIKNVFVIPAESALTEEISDTYTEDINNLAKES